MYGTTDEHDCKIKTCIEVEVTRTIFDKSEIFCFLDVFSFLFLGSLLLWSRALLYCIFFHMIELTAE